MACGRRPHYASQCQQVGPEAQSFRIPECPVGFLILSSFGFGGTNVHCILDAYKPISNAQSTSPGLFTPLVFSAASEKALRSMLKAHAEFLEKNPTTSLEHLAHTLQSGRSTMAYRKAITTRTVSDCISGLQDAAESPSDDLGIRRGQPPHSKLLGIFTGQGAQWARMGAELVESSPFVVERLDELDAALQDLPDRAERPAWTLKEQLLACQDQSRIGEAALAQPLCTAVQIVLVDILDKAGVTFDSVVGHSSGEIGAAYAAGLINAREAIRIAYFRGLYARLAASSQPHAPRGAMMAVGVSGETAEAFCLDEQFVGRLHLAAVNSGSSITLSGDEDAVDEAERHFKDAGTFARKLRVDTAYHSAHMMPCAEPYLRSLAYCSIDSNYRKHRTLKDSIWFSSVDGGRVMTAERLTNQYWVDNMCNSVRFSEALAGALQFGAFDLAIEVGPHPALKGPVTAVLSMSNAKSTPYIGLLARGSSDIEQLSEAFGILWTNLGSGSVDFPSVQTALAGTSSRKFLQDLPPYPFDHQRAYCIANRIPNHFKHRNQITNPLLGNPCSEASTPGQLQWRKILQPSELPWLNGHRLQGQTVFPATGYVSMAVEAIKIAALASSASAELSLIELSDVSIGKAIAFNDETTSIEAIFSLFSIESSCDDLSAKWACYSATGASANVILNAEGHVSCRLSPAVPDTLLRSQTKTLDMVAVDEDEFYRNLEKIGYGYSTPFHGLSGIRRRLSHSVGNLTDESGSECDDKLVVHPGMLDSALQSAFAAWSHPGDTSIWSLHIPVSICRITINPYFTFISYGGKQVKLQYESFITHKSSAKVVSDVSLYTSGGSHTFVQLEGATLVPFSRATAKDDLPMFSSFRYGVATADGEVAAAGEAFSGDEVQMYQDVDRVAYWYARNASLAFPKTRRDDLLPHFQHYLAWCDRMVDMVSHGEHNKVKPEYGDDSKALMDSLVAKYSARKDIQFVRVVGENLVSVIEDGRSMLEHMNQDGLLRSFYEDGAICSGPTGRWLARIIGQMSHRFAGLNILEVGAGTGATTSAVLKGVEGKHASYTFTDISSAFFIPAEELFGEEADRMTFKTFNMEKAPSGQGFTEGSYDVVVAVNVLHVSSDIKTCLANVRALLKPGGFLVVAELTSTDLLFSGMTVGTLPGWWVGADTGRPWGPLLTLDQWDAALKTTGFSGIDTTTPDISASLPMNVFVGQAVDEQVKLLRQPLSVQELPPGVRNEQLALIGGRTRAVQQLCSQLRVLLSAIFHNVGLFATVEGFASSDFARSQASVGAVAVICLTDLDQAFLETMTRSSFDGLKALLGAAGTLMWVTQDARDGKPYSYMMTGILRTVRTEQPHLSAQMYDLETVDGSANDLATAFLQQHFLHERDSDPDTLLWTQEPEIFMRNGRQLIPRLLPDVPRNQRYNARRRQVRASILPDEMIDTLRLDWSNEGAIELRMASPLTAVTAVASTHRRIKVARSMLQNIAIPAAGFLALCTGIDLETSKAVLALCNRPASVAVVPSQWCVSVPAVVSVSELISIAANMIAKHILCLTRAGGSVVCHEAEPAVQKALQEKAAMAHVRTTFTTAQASAHGMLHLDASMYSRTIRKIIPASNTVFVEFSRINSSARLGNTIKDIFAPGCLKLDETALMSKKTEIYDFNTDLREFLQDAAQSMAPTTDLSNFSNPCLNLGQVSTHSSFGAQLTVIDWRLDEPVGAMISPIDSDKLFRADRTYLFVGMTGELGQSLTEWMISRGARNVVLTSRNPKVSPEFIDMMADEHNAVVIPMSMDVTSFNSLRETLDSIAATLPPIAGVINGAMILEDELFANMSYDNFARVTAPKVVGTQLLDEAFHDDGGLEFFIVASSIASLIGWSGQSNYSAANEYMTALVRNRCKRGVPGSVMNVPAVLGVGYAAHAENFDFEYFQSLGHINISEEDLHVLFAEAVLAGRDPTCNPQVGMGVNYIPPNLEVKAAHRRDVKFSHFIRQEKNVAKSGVLKSEVRVKAQLQTIHTSEEATAVIRDAFVAYLRRILRLAAEQSVDETASLVDQGIDSLVAVDIRSWFLKEVGVDVPTLKILAGDSVSGLVEVALKNLHLTSIGETDTVELKEKESIGSSPSSASPVFTPAQGDDGSSASSVERGEHRTK